MGDKICIDVDIRLIISILVFLSNLNNEALDATIEISFFLREDTVITESPPDRQYCYTEL